MKIYDLTTQPNWYLLLLCFGLSLCLRMSDTISRLNLLEGGSNRSTL